MEDLHRTLLWIVGFVLLLIVSALFPQPHLTPAELPEALVIWFFVLNLGAVIAIAFALLYLFRWAKKFLPATFRDAAAPTFFRRKSRKRSRPTGAPFAAHYDSVSVLFADVVEFHADGRNDAAVTFGWSPQRSVSVPR